ncbi:MAG TPA: thioredoxin family protein [Bacteroidota bacterium]|nr:thioredoxin family protein [Bacteroidota bacterium]
MRVSAWWWLWLLLLEGCWSNGQYQIISDPRGAKIVTGRFSPSLLQSDPSFSWYNQNYSSYTPDSEAVRFIAQNARAVRFVVVGGTWCGDTRRELPRFFRVVEEAKIPSDQIELYGVDRMKEGPGKIAEKYDIESVPTFILFSGGKEIGRIVESPHRSIELDLEDLLKKM